MAAEGHSTAAQCLGGSVHEAGTIASIFLCPFLNYGLSGDWQSITDVSYGHRNLFHDSNRPHFKDGEGFEGGDWKGLIRGRLKALVRTAVTKVREAENMGIRS